MRRIEILAPAGSMDTLKTAIHAGADAVYIGGSRFGARAYADNFTESSLLEAISYAHFYGRKLYLTVNTLFKDEELDALYDFLLEPYKQGLDAVIVQDLGVASYIRKQFPDMAVHASTQMTITNVSGVHMLEELGVTRVVPARELSVPELKRMKEETELELEVFVHGALCYCYSGQCLMSSMIGGRSGNRGRCAQPCRLPYLMEGNRQKTKGQSYILSPKDLCGLEVLPELMEIGVDSLKIEGRMKNQNYVAATVSAYRKAVDAILEGSYDIHLMEQLKEEMAQMYNRGGFTEGYYHQANGRDMMSMNRPNHQGIQIGTVARIQKGTISFIAKKEIHKGDVVEIPIKGEEPLELTLGVQGKKGEFLTINAPKTKRITMDTPIYRMKDAALCQRLEDAYTNRIPKENIKISIKILQGTRVTMEVASGDCQVTVTGDMVTEAVQAPLTKAVVKEKMTKLGNTPFQLESLSVTLDENAFLPVRSLNELRREAIEKLKTAMSSRGSRTAVDRIGISSYKESKQEKTPTLSVLLMHPGALSGVLEVSEVTTIYLDPCGFSNQELVSAGKQIRKQNKRVILCMPHIFRVQGELAFDKWLTEDWYDGILVRTLDELGYLLRKQYQGTVIADASLYAYNQQALAYYQEQMPGIGFVMPRELSYGALKNMEIPNLICDIYGNAPVMVSAQCTWNNVHGCNQKNELLTFVDRKGVRYDAQSVCRYCYSLIYSGELYYLKGCEKQVLSLMPCELRLTFRKENAAQAKAVLADVLGAYWQTGAQPEASGVTAFSSVGGFAKSGPMWSTGHFMRGIE